MSEQPQDVAVMANAMDISHFAPPASGQWEDIPRTMDDWTIMPVTENTTAPAPPGSPPSANTSNAANSPDAATTPASSVEETPAQSGDGQQTTEAIPGSIVAVPEVDAQVPNDQTPPNPDAIVEDAKEEKKTVEEEPEEDRDIYDDGAWTTDHVLEFLDMASDKHLELYRATCPVCKTFLVKEKAKAVEAINESEDVVMGVEVVENAKTEELTHSEEPEAVVVMEDDRMDDGEEQQPPPVAAISELGALNPPTEPLPSAEASEDTPMEEAKPVEESEASKSEEVVEPVKPTKTAPKEVESEFPPGWKWSKGCEVCLCHYYQPRPGDEEDFQIKCEEAREAEKARKIKVAEEAAIAAKLAEEAAIAAKIAEEEAVTKAAEMAKKAVEEAEAAAEKAKRDLERADAQVVEVPIEVVNPPSEDATQPPPQPPTEIPVEPIPEQVIEQVIEQPPQPPVEVEKLNEVEMEGVEATPSTPAPENLSTTETEPAPPKEEEAPKEDVIMEETPEPEIPEPEVSPELKALRHTHRSSLVFDAHFTCQICHSPYFSHRPQNGPERPVTTPCHHIAGVACLEEWMEGRDRPGCPFCRQPLIFGCSHKIAHHNAFEKSTPKKIGAGEIMKECYDCGMEKINGKWERAEMLARDARRNAQAALQSAEVRVQDMGSLTPEDEKKRWVALRDLYQQSVTMSEEVREKDRMQREAETKKFKEPLKGTWCKVWGSRYPDESEDESDQDENNENERDDQSDSSDSDSDDGHADNSARRGGRGGFRGRGRGGRGRGW